MISLAIIPARSGSKGIPGKNIRPFAGGVSLLARAVRAARGCPLVDRVIVSTDSQSYARLAVEAGAEVPFLRPHNLSTDTASSESALLHALDWLEREEGSVPDLLVFLQCTSPFVTAGDIEGCLRLLIDGKADCAFTAVRSHAFLWREEEGVYVGVNHDWRVRLRRQEREPEWKETGAVYAMRTEGFRRHGHRFFGRIVACEVPVSRSWEIDDEDDWQACEAMELARRKREVKHRMPSRPRALVLDFDGVITDNRVLVSEEGQEMVICNRSDGLRLDEVRRRRPELAMLILSKERNPVVQARARKLRLDVLQGVDSKRETLARWLEAKAIPWEDVIYVGNDINDLECLEAAGCGVAVADAFPEVLRAADLVLGRGGGRGALREVCELLLEGASA